MLPDAKPTWWERTMQMGSLQPQYSTNAWSEWRPLLQVELLEVRRLPAPLGIVYEIDQQRMEVNVFDD